MRWRYWRRFSPASLPSLHPLPLRRSCSAPPPASWLQLDWPSWSPQISSETLALLAKQKEKGFISASQSVSSQSTAWWRGHLQCSGQWAPIYLTIGSVLNTHLKATFRTAYLLTTWEKNLISYHRTKENHTTNTNFKRILPKQPRARATESNKLLRRSKSKVIVRNSSLVSL